MLAQQVDGRAAVLPGVAPAGEARALAARHAASDGLPRLPDAARLCGSV